MDIYLGESSFAWVGTATAQWAQHGRTEARLEGLFAAAAKEWSRSFVPLPRRGARLWLSGALARPFLFQQPVGLRHKQDRLAMAQARAVEASGQPGPFVVQTEHNRAQGHQQLGVAMDAALLAGIEAAASAARLPLLSIRPWWAGVLDQALFTQPDLELFSARDSDSLILLSATGDSWTSADAYIPLPSEGEADALVRRKMLVCDAIAERVWVATLVSDTHTGPVGQAPAGQLPVLWPGARRTALEGAP